MSGDQQSPAPTPALHLAAARSEPAPMLYWNLCHGILPIAIESPRLFFAAQAIVLIVAVAAVLLLLLVF